MVILDPAKLNVDPALMVTVETFMPSARLHCAPPPNTTLTKVLLELVMVQVPDAPLKPTVEPVAVKDELGSIVQLLPTVQEVFVIVNMPEDNTTLDDTVTLIPLVAVIVAVEPEVTLI